MRLGIRHIVVALTLFATSIMASAQETMAEAIAAGPLKEWKQAFSEEGRQSWKPELTLRLYAGLLTSGPMITGGIRVDERRTLGLFAGHGDTYIDHAPGDLMSVRIGIAYRKYKHLGKRKIVSLYSDFYAGAAYIYEVKGKYQANIVTGEQWEIIDDNPGDILFVGGWQPGIRVRCYRNLHLFLGPTFATDCIGLHLGIGF